MRRLDPRRLTAPQALGALVVVSVVSGADSWSVVFGVVIPEIRHSFHLSLTGVGAISALITPFSLLPVLVITWMGDRYRRTLICAAGISVWAVGTVVVGFAPSVLVLALALIARAIGEDCDSLHRSLLSDAYDPSRRSRVFFAYDAVGVMTVLIAVLAGAGLASQFGWRVGVAGGAPLGLVAAWLINRMADPTRGGTDRSAAGATAEVAGTAEEPPGWGETFRVLRTYPTLRLLYLAVPFIGAVDAGFSLLYSTFLNERFGLGISERGLSFAVILPFSMLGLIATGVLVERHMLRQHLDAALRLAAALMVVDTALIGIVAAAPNLVGALVASAIEALVSGGFVTAIFAVAASVIPPRMRSFGFGIGSLWALPSILAYPAAGAIADAYGIRLGLALTAVPGLMAALLVWLAARTVGADADRSRDDALVRVEARLRRDHGDTALLSVRDLVVDIGSSRILDGIDLEIHDGELVALLGTNGAGKSTLLRALSGLLTPASGQAVFDGVELGGADPAKAVRLGLVYAPGAPLLFDELTVAESLRTAALAVRHGDASIEAVLDVFPALRPRLHTRTSELSGGERQLVNLAQALLPNPKLLMLDELTLGLSGAAADIVLNAVRAIHATGTTVIVVEQSVDRALALAPRAIYLDRGRVRFDGPTTTLRRRPEILRAAFLGEGSESVAAAPAGPAAPAAPAAPALVGRGLTLHYGGVQALGGVNISVARGETLALVGPNGAGKTTVLDVLAGAVKPDAGTVVLNGADVTHLGAAQRAQRGLGRTFQDARLWPSMTVADVVATACERHVAEAGLLPSIFGLPQVRDSEADVAGRVGELLERFGLTANRHRLVAELSTGMRRLVEVMCLVAGEATVLLLDEPAAGIAQREVPGMARLLREMRELTGASMLLVEHDLALVRMIADRVIVLDDGRVIADGPPAAVLDDPAVQLAYLGRVSRRKKVAPTA